MARRYGRAPRGQPLRVGIPHGHGKTTPFVAGLRTTALVAPLSSTARSTALCSRPPSPRVSVPSCAAATSWSWTTCRATRGRGCKGIEAADASLLYLPPDSPDPKDRVSDFHPLETAFAKLKALLRKAAERTIEGLWTAIGGLLETFTPDECANSFAAAGYDAT